MMGNFFKGKKTYIAAALTFVAGGLEAVGYPVPEGALLMLAALGLYGMRKAV